MTSSVPILPVFGRDCPLFSNGIGELPYIFHTLQNSFIYAFQSFLYPTAFCPVIPNAHGAKEST